VRIADRTSVAGVAAITAVLYGILIVGRLASSHWDPTSFIVAGTELFDQSRSPLHLLVRSRDGYDGQYYYRLALDPLTDEKVAYGLTLDSPSYRGQRILYPALAHVVALGRIAWVPWSMIIVNYLAVCGLAISAARLTELFELPPLYGLAIPFLPPVILGLARDLAEPLAISLMVLALLLLHSRRTTFAAFALALAVLARETTLLFAVALLGCSVWRALQKRSTWGESLALTLPLIAYAAWQWRLFVTWGSAGFMEGHINLVNFPFAALGPFVVETMHLPHGLTLMGIFRRLFLASELLFVAAMVCLAAAVVRRSAADPEIIIGWIIYLVLATFLSNLIWVEDWAFMRACEELLMLSAIIVIGARERRFMQIALAATLAMWLPLALRAVLFP
jgi:hypothetical protein